MSNHGHARLSPSSASRWLTCPASVAMADSIVAVPGDSRYADEGTSAHVLAALKAELVFGKITKAQYDVKHRIWEREAVKAGYDIAEMEQCTDGYVQYLQELMDDPDPQVWIERRLDSGVPGVWGTTDFAGLVGNTLHVVDYKHGAGVPVTAEGNPQTRLYGCGALDEFGDLLEDTEYIQITIYQPRIGDGFITSELLHADELRKWRRHVAVPGAKAALSPDAVFNPSEAACRWCPAAGECKPRLLHVTKQDFGDPNVLTPEEIGEALTKVDELEQWCRDIRDAAFAKAYTQQIPIPGFKVVLGSGRRYIVDEPKAIQELLDHDYTPDQVTTTKIKGFGDLEKVVGKKELAEILGDLVDKTSGKPALVPEVDPREEFSAIDSAVKDFG